MRSHVHPEDLSKLDAAFAALRRAGGSCRTEYRLTPRPDDERVGRARWVAIKGAVVRGRNGRPLQLLGVTQDITGRKQAEQALAERNAQFELGRKVAQVGSFTYDYATRTLQLSPTLAAIYGLPEHTPEISREEWQARVHPDDLPHIDVVSRQALANQQGELVLEFRIVRPDGAVRWTESRILISYGDAGRAVHLTGANIDITERKQMAQALSERNIQLSLAAKAGLVGTFAYDTDTEIMQISEGYAVLHGFPEGTTEMARSKCLARVHSDDIGRVVQFRSDALREAAA